MTRALAQERLRAALERVEREKAGNDGWETEQAYAELTEARREARRYSVHRNKKGTGRDPL